MGYIGDMRFLSIQQADITERVLARFRNKLTLLDDGCVVWTGSCNKDGYGLIGLNGSRVYVHRLAWVIRAGKIPDQLVIRHLCKRKNCVLHLESGTHKDNTADSFKDGTHFLQKLREKKAQVHILAS